MLLSQYKIILPSDYDMNIIKNRVSMNGHKTDGFSGLRFKMYLITEKGEFQNSYNSYSPLYFWKDTTGLNKFLFEGYYDNILSSFGWQHVETNVPLLYTLPERIENVHYVFEVIGHIEPKASLKDVKETIQESIIQKDNLVYVVGYNPSLWTYQVFYLLKDKDEIPNQNGTLYQVLHISQ